MSRRFRFSPRPNRASEIQWREWGAAAFEEAERLDRPILLNLTAIWCAACQFMDETSYSDPEVIALLNEGTVPIRVDADALPHVQDRYIAGGWPTSAFLSPTGEVLWSGTTVEVEEMTRVARGVLAAWADRRDELRGEIERRRRALEAARARHPISGLVRREAADDVLTATQDAFDARNGGFGGAPRFPPADVVEPLLTLGWRTGNADWTLMAERTLDGMLSGEIEDRVEGGFFRYARAEDWTEPQPEKVIETSAGLLRAYAMGSRVSGREDWKQVAERTVAWAERVLRRPDGLWAASQVADPEYFRADAAGRASLTPPAVDPVLYTAPNAQWILALAEAGGALGNEAWIARAEAALETLIATMRAPDGLLFHALAPDGEPENPGLLIDVAETGLAAMALAEAAGSAAALAHARALADAMERHLWSDAGGFFDFVPVSRPVGALRYRDRPFELNSLAGRLYFDLALATEERGYRAVAERILAVLSPMAGRFAWAGAPYAQTVEEFFDPPVQVFVVGTREATAELRRAALRLPIPNRRVWTLEQGGRHGTQFFEATDGPAAFVCGMRSKPRAVRSADELDAALPALP